MIISRTPLRLSFFGGGTDYPAWYRENGGGAVLSTTIDKYCYLTCRYLPPFFSHNYRIVWSKVERVKLIDDIEHPSVRACLKYLDIQRGMEIHYDGDLPARSGMGSSSAFIVALLQALHALKGNMLTKAQLTQQSIFIEQTVLGEPIGSQDQASVAYGGFNKITFSEQDDIEVSPVIILPARLKELQEQLLLVYTGIERNASDVAKTYDLTSKNNVLLDMRLLVTEAIKTLTSNCPITEFGNLLDISWGLKRRLSEQVSSEYIDGLYTAAKQSGAVGGKIAGAGGGGFLLLFAPPDRHQNILNVLPDLIHIPFEFEREGSKIVLFDPD